jgi:hypothetical protein
MVMGFISVRQRGQFLAGKSAAAIASAAAPHRGQCLLPRNIIPKHAGQETVAKRELQYWHWVESDDTAAPQLKQLRVSACIAHIVTQLVSDKLQFVVTAENKNLDSLATN